MDLVEVFGVVLHDCWWVNGYGLFGVIVWLDVYVGVCVGRAPVWAGVYVVWMFCGCGCLCAGFLPDCFVVFCLVVWRLFLGFVFYTLSLMVVAPFSGCVGVWVSVMVLAVCCVSLLFVLCPGCFRGFCLLSF